jgi:probable rRNA maturation factor
MPPFTDGAFARRLNAALRRITRRPVDVSVVIVNDRVIRRLNRRFLGHDRPTDVIAFNLAWRCPPLIRTALGGRAGIPFGEVYVSWTTARREARARGIPVGEELLRYAIHGLLHLLGHDDAAPAQRRRMWERQENALRAVLRGV